LLCNNQVAPDPLPSLWRKVMADLPRGTVTFLFTDIEGSTRLWERDRVAMGTAVVRHLELREESVFTPALDPAARELWLTAAKVRWWDGAACARGARRGRPVDPGALHGDMGYLMCSQPVGQHQDVRRYGSKRAHFFEHGPIRLSANHVGDHFALVHVQPAAARINDLHPGRAQPKSATSR